MFNFGFGGMGGGMPPGMGREPPRRREVNNTRFYEILEIERTATEVDIKKAFRKQAMRHHPDKNPDNREEAEAKFKEISKAYEVLSDPQKKTIYDDGGEEALEGGGGGGEPMDIFDLFGGGMFGGGGRGERGPRGPRKGDNVNFPLKVTLEDLYNGTSKKLRLTKNVICSACKGKGGKSGADATCKGCKGHGVRLVVRQLGPGMIQQMQAQCNECRGTGSSIPEKDKCKQCKGEKTVKEKKTLEVFIEKGMKHGEKIPFAGEADEAPDTVPGDVVVILQSVDHPQFKREGSHLVYKKSISLVEALTGFQFYVEHLDGRILLVKSEPGQIYKPGDVKCVRNEGMPSHKNVFQRGNLFVEFDVKFPEPNSISSQSQQLLIQALGAPEKPVKPVPQPNKRAQELDRDMENDGELPATSTVSSEPEEHTLTDVAMHEERDREEENARQAYEEDEEEDGPRGPGCRAQ